MRKVRITTAIILVAATVSGCLEDAKDKKAAQDKASQVKSEQVKSVQKLNALEEALHPMTGSKAKFENFQDIGGLSKSNTFLGLPVGEVLANFTSTGGINEVSFRIPRAVPASDLRTAMSKLCEVQESRWEVQRGDYQSGKAKGPICDTIYLPFSEADWMLVYKKN